MGFEFEEEFGRGVSRSYRGIERKVGSPRKEPVYEAVRGGREGARAHLSYRKQ